MNPNREIFSAKLEEMERQYCRMQSRIRICGQEDHEKIRKELQKAAEEYSEYILSLQKAACESRSPAIRELAKAQLEYIKKTESLLKDGRIGSFIHCEKSSLQEDTAEAAALYAEYAIDYAVQASRYALAAVLSAEDLQMNIEEQKGASPYAGSAKT